MVPASGSGRGNGKLIPKPRSTDLVTPEARQAALLSL